MNNKSLRLLSVSAIIAIYFASCAEVPFLVSFPLPVLDEDAIKKVRGNLIVQLKAAEPLAPSAMASCKVAFANWIDNESKTKFIPADTVSPLVYAAHDAGLAGCPQINVRAEFEKTMARAASQGTTLGPEKHMIPLKAIRKNAEEAFKCIKSFFDPKKHKIELEKMTLRVAKNDLNVESPPYGLYYADKTLDPTDIVNDAEREKLIKSGELVFFAKSAPIPAGQTGTFPMTFTDDPKVKKKSLERLVALDTDIWPISFMGGKPEIKNLGGKEFFVLPQGLIEAHLDIEVFIDVSAKDGECYYKGWREQIREEDKKNKEKYDTQQKEEAKREAERRKRFQGGRS